ncbi:MAG: glycerophosphodiester phosphodiesterase [Rhizobiaceae bacterium]
MCAGVWFLPVPLPVSKHPLFIDGPQVWAHRGSGGRQHPENSPESISVAVAEGFRGVELDIFYLPERDKIVVSHDYHEGEPEDLMPPLDRFNFPADLALWLDFKNLRRLSEDQVAKFAASYRRLQLPNEVFIESTAPEKLQLLDPELFQRVLWLSLPRQRGWDQISYLIFTKFQSLLAGFDAVSFPKQQFDVVTPHFAGRSTFVFTVNDPKQVASVWRSGRTAVILTDLHRSAALKHVGPHEGPKDQLRAQPD